MNQKINNFQELLSFITDGGKEILSKNEFYIMNLAFTVGRQIEREECIDMMKRLQDFEKGE